MIAHKLQPKGAKGNPNLQEAFVWCAFVWCPRRPFLEHALSEGQQELLPSTRCECEGPAPYPHARVRHESTRKLVAKPLQGGAWGFARFVCAGEAELGTFILANFLCGTDASICPG